jgi:hypothetical protein
MSANECNPSKYIGKTCPSLETQIFEEETDRDSFTQQSLKNRYIRKVLLIFL